MTQCSLQPCCSNPFCLEDHATHATEVSCTSQLQQWNKPVLKPNSPTLIRDACFTMHKDDKADIAAAVICKLTITYYEPRRPGDRAVNEARFDEFKKDLESAPFKCGWSLQLTQHIIETSHETLHFHFPLAQQGLNDACTKILQTLSTSESAAKELECKTRWQSLIPLWHQSQACRITASKFGNVCKCSWFKTREVTNIQSLLKDCIAPLNMTHTLLQSKAGLIVNQELLLAIYNGGRIMVTKN